MPIRIVQPCKIPVLSYDKVFLDELNANDWLFAVQNAVLIDGELYLTRWI